jgi:uncharacterized membrane protein YgdD (TMEM256/DUF423 family)
MALADIRAFGMVTPVGGAAFIAGWACLAWAALRSGAPGGGAPPSP